VSIPVGDYVGRIVEHGTTERNGKPWIWFQIDLVLKRDDKGDPEPFHSEELITCRQCLEGGDEEKTQTCLRMARATLKLCGFDPDARELSDLDANPRWLAGNEVPVRVSERESNGRFYTNYDIAVPRATVGGTRAKSLTQGLRAVKSKGEPDMKPMPNKPAFSGPPASLEEQKKAVAQGGVGFDDIPFDRDPCI